MSKFVEIQSRLTFSCKSWKNVSQIIDFADIFPGFLCFLHFWGIIHPSKFHFMEIRWQNFKNKQTLSAPKNLLLLTPSTYHACNVSRLQHITPCNVRKEKVKENPGQSYNLSGVFIQSLCLCSAVQEFISSWAWICIGVFQRLLLPNRDLLR